MYTIAICDDDEAYQLLLRTLLLKLAQQRNEELNIQLFHSGQELLESHSIISNLVILDMEMPGLNGYETAQQLKQKNPDCLLAFCTGKCEPKPEHFDVHPFCYIMKQYPIEQIVNKLEALINELSAHDDYRQLLLACDGKVFNIPISEIMYLDKAKRGSYVHLSSKMMKKDFPHMLLSNKKLADLYKQIASPNFAYAHSSYVVNLAQIQKLSEKDIILMDGELLNISRNYREAFHTAYARFCGENYRRRK